MQRLFDAGLKLSAPSGATFGATTVTRFSVGVGNRSVGYALMVPVSAQGNNLVVYEDLLFVARDRAGIQLLAVNVGQPFDRATEIALARTMYERIGTNAN